MADIEIGVVGAGLAGLACAGAVKAAGLAPVVFDKSRGVGGRLATRRAEGGLSFDHGAQYLTARTQGFSALLTDISQVGQAAPWEDGSDEQRFVGLPGMNAIAKHMASGLEVRSGIAVDRVSQTKDGWDIAADTDHWSCERVVLALPAPQAMALLGNAHPLAQELLAVRMAPCLALMAVIEGAAGPRALSRRYTDDPLAWIALNSSKPGRSNIDCWVAHASPEWSEENLEQTPEDIVGAMLPLLCGKLGADLSSVRHVAAHRWRYAKVTAPLGRPFARDHSGTLHIGGDWCLGARAECAWESGTAIARDVVRLR